MCMGLLKFTKSNTLLNKSAYTWRLAYLGDILISTIEHTRSTHKLENESDTTIINSCPDLKKSNSTPAP